MALNQVLAALMGGAGGGGNVAPNYGTPGSGGMQNQPPSPMMGGGMPQITPPPNEVSFDVGSIGNGPTGSFVDLANIFTPQAQNAGSAMPSAPDYAPNERIAQGFEDKAYGLKPTQVRSNLGAKDLLALFGAALMGQNGSQFLQGYAGAKQQGQIMRQQEAQQMDQNAQMALLKKAAAARAQNALLQKTYGDQIDAWSADRRAAAAEMIAKGHDATSVLNKTADIEQKGRDAEAKVKAAETKAESDKQIARVKSYASIFGKVPPESRPGLMRQLGITDPDAIDFGMTLRPDEVKAIAGANKADAETNAINTLLPEKLKAIQSKYKLDDKRTAQIGEFIKHLPVKYQEEAAINRAKVANYDDMVAKRVKGGGKSGKADPAVTATLRAVEKDLGEFKKQRDEASKRHKIANNQILAYTVGDKKDDADAKEKIAQYKQEFQDTDYKLQDLHDTITSYVSARNNARRALGIPDMPPVVTRERPGGMFDNVAKSLSGQSKPLEGEIPPFIPGQDYVRAVTPGSESLDATGRPTKAVPPKGRTARTSSGNTFTYKPSK